MNLRKVGLIAVGLIVVALFLLNRKPVELVKQDAFTATPIANTGYILQSAIHLYNPNLLSATIKTISEKYFIEGREVSIMSMEVNQGIPGMKETTFPTNVRFGVAELDDIFINDCISKSKKVELNVIGEITYESMMSSGKVSVNQKDSVIIFKL